MRKPKCTSIDVQETAITIISHEDGSGALIERWLKNKDAVLFPGAWEQLNNPDFNSLEFEGIKYGEFATFRCQVTARRRQKLAARLGISHLPVGKEHSP